MMVSATTVTDMTFKADTFDLSHPAEVRTATDRCDDRLLDHAAQLTTIVDIGSRLANSTESHEF